NEAKRRICQKQNFPDSRGHKTPSSRTLNPHQVHIRRPAKRIVSFPTQHPTVHIQPLPLDRSLGFYSSLPYTRN
ncbi:hypothetical protein PanWU01x14_103040, partial [Parasponia andersonii]